MNYLSVIATIATILAVGIVAAGIIVGIKELFPADNCPETPPFTYVPPPQACAAIREAQQIVAACWTEEAR